MKGQRFVPYFKIFGMTQEKLKQYLCAKLRDMGRTFISRDGYLYSPGSMPIMLVAHMDTVHKSPVQSLCASPDGILMSPEGIGGDDRCGVMMILELIKTHDCHILFCEDEETGSQGARKYVSDMKDQYPYLHYMIEIDRRGTKDCVFYDCDNDDFVRFVEQFGFKEAYGTFSDISVLAPSIGVAAVNISAGYMNEHTLHETVNLPAMDINVERLSKMIGTYGGEFEYVHRKWFNYSNCYGGWYDDDDDGFGCGGYYSRAYGYSSDTGKSSSNAPVDAYEGIGEYEMGEEALVPFSGETWRDVYMDRGFTSKYTSSHDPDDIGVLEKDGAPKCIMISSTFGSDTVLVDQYGTVYTKHPVFENVAIIHPLHYILECDLKQLDFSNAETYEWYSQEMMDYLLYEDGD